MPDNVLFQPLSGSPGKQSGLPEFKGFTSLGEIKEEINRLISEIESKIKLIKEEFSPRIASQIEKGIKQYLSEVRYETSTIPNSAPVSNAFRGTLMNLEEYYYGLMAIKEALETLTTDKRLVSILEKIRDKEEIPSFNILEASVILYNRLQKYYGRTKGVHEEIIEVIEHALSVYASEEEVLVPLDSSLLRLAKLFKEGDITVFYNKPSISITREGVLVYDYFWEWVHFIPINGIEWSSSDVNITPEIALQRLMASMKNNSGKKGEEGYITIKFKGSLYEYMGYYYFSSFLPVIKSVRMYLSFKPEARFTAHTKGLIHLSATSSILFFNPHSGFASPFSDIVALAGRFLVDGKPLLVDISRMDNARNLYILNPVGLLSAIKQLTWKPETITVEIGMESDSAPSARIISPSGEWVYYSSRTISFSDPVIRDPQKAREVLEVLKWRDVFYVYAPVYVFPVKKDFTVYSFYGKHVHIHYMRDSMPALIGGAESDDKLSILNNIATVTREESIITSIGIVDNAFSEKTNTLASTSRIPAFFERFPFTLSPAVSLPVLSRGGGYTRVNLPKEVLDENKKVAISRKITKNVDKLSGRTIIGETSILVDENSLPTRLLIPVIAVDAGKSRVEVYLNKNTYVKQSYYNDNDLLKLHSFDLQSLGFKIAPRDEVMPPSYIEAYKRKNAPTLGFASTMIVLNDLSRASSGDKLPASLALSIDDRGYLYVDLLIRDAVLVYRLDGFTVSY